MGVFRNRDFVRQLALALAVTVAAAAAAMLAGGKTVCLAVLACSLLWDGLYLGRECGRYRQMRVMAEQIDEVLHGQELLELEHFREGDLEILRDEVYKMTLRLREQAEQLRREKTVLADSLADISHQIRTPLTTINILLERLRSPQLEPETRRRLLREAGQMLDKIEWLVSALLKMSKLDAGAIALKRETLSLETLLSEAVAPFAAAMEVRGKTCRIRGAEGVCVEADRAWTLEALQNVIKNGVEYTPDGGTLTVSCQDNPLYTEIAVADSGSGIPEEDLPHLFERFYRGKNAGKDSFGVGLALAQRILSRENAVIRAENAQEGGGRFRIRFYKTAL